MNAAAGHTPSRAARPRSRRRGARLRNALAGLRSTLWHAQVSSASRERRDLLFLLLAVALVAAPHLPTLPAWAVVALVTLWGLRLTLTLTQRPSPSSRWTWPLLVVVGLAVYAEHRTWFGAAAGTLFLLLLLGLKLLELRARRDVFVIIFLSFFILLTLFLHSQSLSIALLTVATVVLLFVVLISVNLSEGDVPTGHKLKYAGLFFLKALPLTALLFVLFPRLSGPLWGMPSLGAYGRTGLSESMSPGSLGQLLESDAIAFRARFDGPLPPNERLYWRGPTLNFFNGRSWSPGHASAPALRVDVQPPSAVSYTITLEPHARNWLFALEWPQPPAQIDGLPVAMDAYGQLLSSQPVNGRLRYTLLSYTEFSMGRNETQSSLQSALQLPHGFNPRTLAYARTLRERLANLSAAQRNAAAIQTVLQQFRTEGFRYTLEPTPLGRDGIDDFLFETREGYCEHYASAFVTLMRALHIPARVVTGYQGGELNPVDGFVTIRQSDAHAWAEVWLPDRGWLRIDPTAMVAPDRIDQGASERALARGRSGALGRVAALAWLRQTLSSVRFNWEALQNAWNQWVLSYSAQRQRQLLQRLGFEPNLKVLGLLLAISLVPLLGILAWLSLRQRTVNDPLGEVYAQLRRSLAQAGVASTAHTGPRSLMKALEPLSAESRQTAQTLLQQFEALRYARSSSTATHTLIKAFALQVKQFKPSLRKLES